MNFRVVTIVILGHDTLTGNDLYDLLPVEVIAVMESFGGRFSNEISQVVSAVFESPSAAVQACTAASDALSTKPETAGISFAINTGEIDQETERVGRTFEITKHIAKVVAAGTINFAEATYLSMSKDSSPSTFVGQHVFRGIPEAITIHTVIQSNRV